MGQGLEEMICGCRTEYLRDEGQRTEERTLERKEMHLGVREMIKNQDR